jgi:tetratricopeptide (TPR) repeat protein
MKSGRDMRGPTNGKIGLFTIAFLFAFSGCSYALTSEMPSPSGQQASSAPLGDEVKQMLSIAESQHEIVILLIKQGQYQRVVPEMKKIFELNLPEKYEEAVAQSASLIAGMLVERQQFAVAHEVVNEALKRARLNENKAALFKVEGYVYKSEGNLEKALESLEKAVQLERARIRR